ncbi:uncharacterized protein M421DRAFT_235120 [Didymella exigua CBS 183.55]|uniref:Uncharacterized protein n=1 Tax=Didymella exigua CBS 183.55 TaxID=1150837 RepID=A0A6A5RE41_9PLEO|nr:uncharacterized protein M421DRAFT_235120 [Didymella exigua CBS 183.55]KAF1925669.1 hypothetical protein M421DRAFT_235120 [Didymella exigua CBS 183.55]
MNFARHFSANVFFVQRPHKRSWHRQLFVTNQGLVQHDMASTEAQIFIVHRSFNPSGAYVDSWLSNFYADLSSVQHCAQRVRDDVENDGAEAINTDGAFSFTMTYPSYTCDISIHPLLLPEHMQPNCGYVVCWTCWPSHLVASLCPVDRDLVSRFTGDEARGHAAALAYHSSHQSAGVDSHLTVVHNQCGLPRRFGESEAHTHFTIEVFRRSVILGEVQDRTEDLGVMSLKESLSW